MYKAKYVKPFKMHDGTRPMFQVGTTYDVVSERVCSMGIDVITLQAEVGTHRFDVDQNRRFNVQNHFYIYWVEDNVAN